MQAPKRRSIQVSLRGMLIVVFIICLCVAWFCERQRPLSDLSEARRRGAAARDFFEHVRANVKQEYAHSTKAIRGAVAQSQINQATTKQQLDTALERLRISEEYISQWKMKLGN